MVCGGGGVMPSRMNEWRKDVRVKWSEQARDGT